jgi:hypothetical protein
VAPRAPRRTRSPKAEKKRKAKAEARAITKAVRADLRQPTDVAWGTSPGSLAIVKASSEEARHATCFECGYSGGRHARICSQQR